MRSAPGYFTPKMLISHQTDVLIQLVLEFRGLVCLDPSKPKVMTERDQLALDFALSYLDRVIVELQNLAPGEDWEENYFLRSWRDIRAFYGIDVFLVSKYIEENGIEDDQFYLD